MIVKVNTVNEREIYVNLTNVSTLRVVPVSLNKFAISMSILPGKELLVKVNGTDYYSDRATADGVLESFAEVFNQVVVGGLNAVQDALCWFGDCKPNEEEDEEPGTP